MRLMSVTPRSECVVAPAGYSFAATTRPLSFAARTSPGGVASVRYSVIRGSKSLPGRTAARIRSR